jgi:quercetin dioxygenase-like cupin family protein
MEINQWTQSITVSAGVISALKHGDVHLLDEDGNPFAVLVDIDRYNKEKEDKTGS